MINEHLNKLELTIKDNQNPLDKPISHKELIDTLQSLNPLDNPISHKELIDTLQSLNPLDKPISHKELIEKLQSLKSKKSCGLDGIKNEMLKK